MNSNEILRVSLLRLKEPPLLYHYSTTEFKELLTLRKGGDLSRDLVEKYDKKTEERNAFGNYMDHISFFIDPLPRNMVTMTEGRHSIWKPKTMFFEHVIDISAIGDFKFSLVATPELLEFAEQNSHLPSGSYFSKERKLADKLGYNGSGIDALLEALTDFKDMTENMIREQYRTLDDRKLKYHATEVTHVMLYPETGVVPVLKVNRVVFD